MSPSRPASPNTSRRERLLLLKPGGGRRRIDPPNPY
jgi:hypothetical protein